MKIHEYQAKQILKKYGCRGAAIRFDGGDARRSRSGGERVAEVWGRAESWSKRRSTRAGAARAGGGKIAKSVAEAGEIAGKMLGMTLITHQTGPEGRVVRRLLVEETLPIEKELYLGILKVDRGEGKPVFMARALAAGGMDIEQVAAETPEAILKQYIDPGMGLEPFQARKIAFALGLKPAQINPAVQFLTGLHNARSWRPTVR